MTYRTMLDLIQETTTETGTESLKDYSIVPVTALVGKFKESDVTLLLSWAGGIILTEAIGKVEQGMRDDLDEDEILEILTEKEQAMIYGAYLLTESGEGE